MLRTAVLVSFWEYCPFSGAFCLDCLAGTSSSSKVTFLCLRRITKHGSQRPSRVEDKKTKLAV